jgi:hypothetical protein
MHASLTADASLWRGNMCPAARRGSSSEIGRIEESIPWSRVKLEGPKRESTPIAMRSADQTIGGSGRAVSIALARERSLNVSVEDFAAIWLLVPSQGQAK